jgi:ribosomal protein L32
MTGKRWICKNCGHEFAPDSEGHSCPKCGTSNTIPTGLKIEPIKTIVRELATRACTECGGTMYRGYLVNPDGAQLTTMFEDMSWTLKRSGFVLDRVSLNAFACKDCGKVSLYAPVPEKIRKIIEKVTG